MSGDPQAARRVCPELLLERFEEVDFLEQLWRRCREKLHPELDGVQSELARPTPDWTELGSLLHRLRGLLMNFLQGQQSIAELVECERAVTTRDPELLQSAWDRFHIELERDTQALNDWIAAHPPR